MERRLLLSTVAIALALGSVVASAQTRRPSDQNQQTAPQSTQAQPPQGQMRANPQPGGAAENQPQPNAPVQNAAPQVPAAPSATTGQAAPQPQQPSAPAANNQAQQPAAGQAQTQPAPQQGAAQPGGAQQGAAQQGQAQPAQAQPGMAQQPGNAAGTANTGAGGANGNANANTNAPQGNQQGVITLNEQQNTRVSVAIRQTNVQPLTNVSFSIAVGTTIPADIQVHVLPPALVEVVPQYRDFNFVVVEQEALIIDPNSRAIVAVIPFEARQTTGANTAPAPAPAPAQAAAPPLPPERKKLDLTHDQREIPRRQVERHRKADKDKHVIIEERRTTTGAGPREPRVGDRVPDSAVIEGRPVEVYRDGPPVRDDRPRPGLRDIPLIGPLFGPPHED